MSCSSKRNRLLGSCSSTLVSSTNSLAGPVPRALRARGAGAGAAGRGAACASGTAGAGGAGGGGGGAAGGGGGLHQEGFGLQECGAAGRCGGQWHGANGFDLGVQKAKSRLEAKAALRREEGVAQCSGIRPLCMAMVTSTAHSARTCVRLLFSGF